MHRPPGGNPQSSTLASSFSLVAGTVERCDGLDEVPTPFFNVALWTSPKVELEVGLDVGRTRPCFSTVRACYAQRAKSKRRSRGRFVLRHDGDSVVRGVFSRPMSNEITDIDP